MAEPTNPELETSKRKITDIIAMMVVSCVLIVVSIVILFPVFSGKEFAPYLESLKSYSDFITTPLAFILGYYFNNKERS